MGGGRPRALSKDSVAGMSAADYAGPSSTNATAKAVLDLSGSWTSLLPWKEFLFWLFWAFALYQFGPSSGTAAKSLEELNHILAGEISVVNTLISDHLPSGVGECDHLKRQEESE